MEGRGSLRTTGGSTQWLDCTSVTTPTRKVGLEAALIQATSHTAEASTTGIGDSGWSHSQIVGAQSHPDELA